MKTLKRRKRKKIAAVKTNPRRKKANICPRIILKTVTKRRWLTSTQGLTQNMETLKPVLTLSKKKCAVVVVMKNIQIMQMLTKTRPTPKNKLRT